MNVSKYALMRIIHAARISKLMAESIRLLTFGSNENKADMIAGDLADALYAMTGETSGVHDDFSDSRTYTWLFASKMSDEEVADEFIRMSESNSGKVPNLISKIHFDELLKNFGGYKAETPEGEWT